MNRTSGQRRYLTTNSSQAAFALSAGRITLTNSGGIYIPSSGSSAAFQRFVPIGPWRGGRWQFFGTGADNATANYRLWLARAHYANGATEAFPEASKILDVEIVPYIADTSTITLSTLTGVTGAVDPQILAAERIADTITATLSTTATTPAGPGAVLEAAYNLGYMNSFSPAGNAAPAELTIPDFGAGVFAWCIEFDMTGATDMNALYEHTR